jgi:hypothetical protein
MSPLSGLQATQSQFSLMATPAQNQIEIQFAHLPPAEQLALLERLVHQMRSVGAHNGSPHPGTVSATEADPRFRREWDGVNVDFRASESDLLSEA